jgi:chaperonin GroES
MILEPFGERVIVKRLCSDTTAGGIILPDSAKQRSLRGEVVSSGPSCEWVKKGDEVVFGEYSGFSLSFGHIDAGMDDCLIMNEEDILAKVGGS